VFKFRDRGRPTLREGGDRRTYELLKDIAISKPETRMLSQHQESKTTLTSPKRFLTARTNGLGARCAGILSDLPFLLLALCLLILLTGCVSNEEAAAQAQRAYEAGFQQGQATAKARRTQVFFRGSFQQQSILWRPDLTVAQAIVEAVYTAPTDPTSIIITRNGEPMPVDPQNLLRGIDFLLEPGDTVHLVE
jgi:hypothetical protein